jgi:hypothetical protein
MRKVPTRAYFQYSKMEQQFLKGKESMYEYPREKRTEKLDGTTERSLYLTVSPHTSDRARRTTRPGAAQAADS